MPRLCNFTLSPEQLDEYFEVIAQEQARAWRKYQMLVMPGLEFNKDGYTKKSSAHLLGVDLRYPVDPTLDIPDLIQGIQSQGALAIASHPHIMQSEWGKNTLFLWNHRASTLEAAAENVLSMMPLAPRGSAVPGRLN